MCPLALSDCHLAEISGAKDASDPLSLLQETRPMHAPIKYFEKGLSIAANGAWVVFSNLNKIAPHPSITPKWSDKPLLKSYEKTKPPLGWPRETDSLCPTCTREARQAILDGKKDV